MKIKLAIAFVGNIIDAIATVILLQRGFVELNPFMAWLLQWPMVAITCKVVAVTALLVYIWCKRGTKYVDELASFAAMLYGGLAVYYILMLI